MQRDFKGIWIPKEIWLSKTLTLQEKMFLVEIDSLDNENGCYASNNHFAEFFNLSKNRCSEVIKSLEKKGYISVEYIREQGQKNIKKRVIRVFDKSNRGYSENRQTYSESRRGYSEKCEGSNTFNNTSNNTSKRKDEEGDPIINLLIENKIIHPAGITRTLADDLNDVTENFCFDNPDEMILEAIKDATRGNGKTWKFIYNKLVLWRKLGIKNTNDLEANKEREVIGNRNKNHSGSSAKGTSYEQALREAELARKSFNR